MVFIIVKSKLASLHELQTVYSVEDTYDLLETLQVDGHNQGLVQEFQSRQRPQN
jgi:hypothetical protein